VGDELHDGGSRLEVALSMQNAECRVQNSKVRSWSSRTMSFRWSPRFMTW